MTQYEHTQIGHVIIWGALGAAVLVAVTGIVESVPPVAVSLVLEAVLLTCAIVFSKLTIKIDDETLGAYLGPGLVCKKVPLVEIAACEPVRVLGWGIHFTPYGLLYNVSGFDAVAIALRNGQKFALGTDDPQGLAEAIRAAIL
ncbi:MAG: hypothetical protein WBX14_00015 [Candidatus Udaeobacter sp.]